LFKQDIQMKEGRDQWLQPLLDNASIDCEAEVMDACQMVHRCH
jgi:acetyl-CoA synthetase